MNKWLKSSAVALAFAASFAAMVVQPVMAAGFFTNGVPTAGGTQYPTTIPLTGNETVPADTNLTNGQNPASEAITTAQLQQWGNQGPSRGNAIIGGDATTNLWQRGTSGASETTTYAYGGPDRWFYWSGTNTAMTVSRDSTAADVPAGYEYAFKMARTNAQTGTVQMCMAQEIESVNSYQFAGATAELDFHAATGANFSPSSLDMTAYVIYGTGTDEGAQKLAYGLNAGGGGSVGWTGQANATAAVINLGATSNLARYAAFASIPATATEMGVALCYTPSGTAGANDYVAFSGIQLTRNASSNLVSATAGYACETGTSSTSSTAGCTGYERRFAAFEARLQYRYYYQLAEGAAAKTEAMCRSRSTTSASCQLLFPEPMRVAPTMTYTAGFAVETTALGGTLGACSNLATDVQVSTNGPNVNNVQVECTATTVPAAGDADTLYDDGNSGLIKASAEL